MATMHRFTAGDSAADMLPEAKVLNVRRILAAALFFATISLSCLVLFRDVDSNRFFSSFPSSYPLPGFPSIFPLSAKDPASTSNEYPLEKVLKEAAMEDRTVILTTEEADFHEEAYFMTPRYLMMMWRRIDFLRSVLEMGYNFVFTDADIMWFRDPFPRFHLDADFQIACDHFTGSFDDVQNRPNGGFNFVKSNNRSLEFYKFWYSSRETYPGYHDQDVLNFIKVHPFIIDIGLKMRFLDTANFGGLCEPSRDLNQVCTMHANCCFGMDSKLHDLRIMLQDWKHYLSLPPSLKKLSVVSWRIPQKCSLDSLRHHGSPEESVKA
ncbi:Nucleotide-diphospho-sugar transferase [Sesbania bispinosa]|nr:Nucleotide-diphospho-sugar transferase [Sesbania bispinosa]